MRELIEYPLVHPEVYAHLGIEPVRTMRSLVLMQDCVAGLGVGISKYLGSLSLARIHYLREAWAFPPSGGIELHGKPILSYICFASG